jgi:membrane protein DedA with SNARE-associated domain
VSPAVDQLLTLLLLHGYPVLFAVVLVAAAGAPLPTGILVLAAGAFAADGELNLATVVATAAGAAVAGDLLACCAARRAGEALVARHGARVGLGPARLTAARRWFARWAGATVFLTRWLVAPLGPPVNVIAGVAGYPVVRFAAASAAGQAVWAAAYAGTGYAFGVAWPTVADALGDAAWLLTGLALLGAAGAALLLVPRGRVGPERVGGPHRADRTAASGGS